MKFAVIFLCILFCPSFSFARNAVFEKNLGQAAPSIGFVARGDGFTIGFSREEIIFYGKSGKRLALRFAAESRDARWEALDPLPSTSSYFIGNNPNSWIRKIPHFGRLARRNIYPGIDAVFHGNGERIEYDFEVAPGADPRRIRMEWLGADRQSISANGDLEVHAGTETLICRKPELFQKGKGQQASVSGGFVLSGDASTVSFAVGAYDSGATLTIDPTVDVLQFLGGTGNDRITAMLGGTVAGVTDSSGLIGFGGRASGTDVFVWNGQFYTLYGGSGDEEPTSIALVGNTVIIAGWTSSRDFPATGSQSFQRTFGGGNTDGFILANPSPGTLTYSSYLGGSGDDRILAIVPDTSSPPGTINDLSGYILAGDTTSPDFPVLLASQPALAGGKDGFITRVGATGAIIESTYWGGSGDDSILAIGSTFSSCWFAGRTSSSDLPVVAALQPQLAGKTDAFLARLNTSTVPSVLDFATYYGGQGDDEITALKIGPDSWVWTGGNTTSADLPLVQPWQTAIAGHTDSWIARFDPRHFTPSFVTYFGGSGNEQLTSLTHDLNGDLYVGGITNSTDLPVLNAMQPQAGGGGDGLIGRAEARGPRQPNSPLHFEPDDGFVAHLDSHGQLQMATYVGGKGEDRIFALTTGTDGSITAGGESNSPSIPALEPPGATAAQNAGGFDGLSLRFHQDGIYAAPLTVGNGMTVPLPVTLIGASAAGLPVTVLSTDPTRVQVNGGKSFTGTTFQLSGLAASGVVDVIVSAPGLAPRHVPVNLQPSYLVNTYTAPIPVALNTSTSPTFQFATTDAATGQLIYQTPASVPNGSISFFSSDTTVVLSETSGGSGSPLSVSLYGVGAGSASIAIVSPAFPVLGPQQLNVTVAAPAPILQPPNIVVGEMLETSLPLPLSPVSAAVKGTVTVTLTSEDPSRVLLSAAPGTAGAGSITFPWAQSFGGPTPQIWVHGLTSSGVVRIRVDVASVSSVYANVALAPSIIEIATPSETLNTYFSGVHHNPDITSVSLRTWSTRTTFGLTAQIDNIPPAGFAVRDQLPSPESANQFQLSSSDNSVVLAGGDFAFDLGNGTPYVLFGVGLEKAGIALLSVSAGAFKTSSLQVTVLPGDLPFSQSTVTLGKDLQTGLYFDPVFDFPVNVTITIASSDPTRVLVSSLSSNEAASINLSFLSSGSVPFFNVSALADSGDVPITIQATGFGSRTLVVHLEPTTWGLTPSTVTTPIGGFVQTGVKWKFSNEPTGTGYTGIGLRPSLRYTFALTVSDPTVLANQSPVVTFANFGSVLQLAALKTGTAIVTITSTSAAVVDPQSASATVTVIPQTFAFGTPTLVIGKDMQRQLPGFSSLTNSSSVTLSSSDPSRVLLTKDPGLPGSATLTNVNGIVYVQALSDTGDIQVTASAAGYSDAMMTVRLVPTAFGFFDQSGRNTVFNGSIGNPFSMRIVPAGVDPASGNPIVFSDAVLRPNLAPFNLTLLSSSPSVGSVLSPIAFIGGLSQNTTQFRPATNGTTQVSVTPPAGYADGGTALQASVQISPPNLGLTNLTLGKDMQYTAQLGVTGASFPSTFTVTSSDPSRVLVSASPTAIGSASVTVTGGTSGYNPFFVQALSSSGDVTISASATGFNSASANVHLEPSYFSFDLGTPPSQPATATTAAGTTLNVDIFFIHPSFDYLGIAVLRAGVGPITVPVISSNPAVVSQTTAFTISSGSYQAFGQFNANAAGTATLQIGAPGGFSTAPDLFRTENVTIH
ncbi:MAG TPA: hypothetical protein VK789_14490 [Bryobacteraceae bacterium]|nr:hypothetical protein [Bryobacteraceae bacterium]